MDQKNNNLILASQSPRRRQLLEDAGFEFSVIVPDEKVERLAQLNLPPAELVVELARQKAQHVAHQVTSGLILAADTIAHCLGEILGKPESIDDARRMLQLMSGQRHEVLTGVCLWSCPDNHYRCFLEASRLRMDELRRDDLESYLSSKNWIGKAGAFGYQDGLDWVHLESGLASNVVGLPVERLDEWIEQFA